MNVNEKGVSGLIKVVDDLQMNGISVFLPFDDHNAIDLIAVISGKTIRLQVKYRAKDKFGKYPLPTDSIVNGKRIPINRELIDGWAIYLKDDNKVVYVPRVFMENHKSRNIDATTDYGRLAEWSNATGC